MTTTDNYMTTSTIPIPDNPEHVRNLESISLLEAQGFTGADASLAESLFEYGWCWRALDNGEILFVYRVHGDGENAKFNRCTLKADLDARSEWNWVKWADLMSFLGMTESEWFALPLEHKLGDLIAHYGTEEILGACYWEGFGISAE